MDKTFAMEASKQLTNLQLELLRVFNAELSDEQLKEIRTLLADYFAKKATTEVDRLFEEKGWGAEKIKEWSQEHMRTEYRSS